MIRVVENSGRESTFGRALNIALDFGSYLHSIRLAFRSLYLKSTDVVLLIPKFLAAIAASPGRCVLVVMPLQRTAGRKTSPAYLAAKWAISGRHRCSFPSCPSFFAASFAAEAVRFPLSYKFGPPLYPSRLLQRSRLHRVRPQERLHPLAIRATALQLLSVS